MPELKNVFHAGRMNKDLDERLIPNGEYRDALNIDVSFSESNDAGSAQNSYGNIVKSTVGISGGVCIGSIANKQEETIIWFISGTSIDAIAEYNTVTNEVVPILVDTNKGNSNAFLNFSEENLITGINVLDDFLFFTDNNSEPKKINISRMKNGSTNFSTTTKHQNSDGTYTNNVYESLITVIKKYPLNAPSISLDSSIRTGNVKGVAHTLQNTTYVASTQATAAQVDSQDYSSKNIMAKTSGSSSIYNLTDDRYIERVCNTFIDDTESNIISFNITPGGVHTDYSTGEAYKKWRAVEPGMKIAITSEANVNAAWIEPTKHYTIRTVDWLNHTVTIDADKGYIGGLGSRARISHWSKPYNNDYFWAYKDSSGSVIPKPIGTSSDNYIDVDGNILKDGGILGDGTGYDIALTPSDATSGTEPHQFETGWEYSSGTKTYSYNGGSNSGTFIYPKITKSTDLLAGHIYKMDFTITVASGTGTIGFKSSMTNANATVNPAGTVSSKTINTSSSQVALVVPGMVANHSDYPSGTVVTAVTSSTIVTSNAPTSNITSGNIDFINDDYGLNGVETRRRSVGTYKMSITWKQNYSDEAGMLCLFASNTIVGTVKIDTITCLTKPRVVKTQPIQFYGDTSYEVNDIIKLQASDVSAVNYDDDKFVDITLKLTEKIRVVNNTLINTTHALAIGDNVTGNDKIAGGDFTTPGAAAHWHVGSSGTTDVGTSSGTSDGFYISGNKLTSADDKSGYIRNVLTEDLVAGNTYKLTYTVNTATTGTGSGSRGYLLLILGDEDKYTEDDLDYGHSNHISLPTDTTGTKTIYFKQKSLERGAWNSGTTNQHGLKELKLYNNEAWNGLVDNFVLKKVTGTAETTCGVIGSSSGRQMFDYEILSMDSSIIDNLGNLSFVSKRIQQDAIYEKEFPRFSYRWKYIDNEYSTISPFTEVAFLPKNDDGYSYDSKNGYNKSMINDLRRVTLSGIKDMPEDVKSIDILYKKSNSPSVYTLRTIEGSEFGDLKTSDTVVITSEEIKSLLPENQMLRPYDNVPRKAKAQEVTANRIVYGNYLQQYNYFNSPPEFKVKINSSNIEDIPKKSLKSIRDYQIGVVYLDEYGRQTPVFTHETGIIKLDQSKAAKQNSIQCSLLSAPPTWATHYKYYIKDSSNEYYNLAMDRFYSDVEDENVWVSFPSSEINKVNENDYIAIKKQHDNEDAVSVPSGATLKYKVLDKQAETPSHLRFKMESIGSSNEGVSFSAGSVVSSSDNNETKNQKYDKQLYKYPTRYQSQFLVSAYDLRGDTELLEELEGYITNTGVWYKIENRFIDIKSSLSGTISQKYELTEIYKKTIVEKIDQQSGSDAYTTGVTDKGNICVMINQQGGITSSTVNLGVSNKTSKSNDKTVDNPDEDIKVGMRLVGYEDQLHYKSKVILVTKVSTNQVTLSEAIEQSHQQEIHFKDCSDLFYFKIKKPFGSDIQFVGQGPQPTKLELLDIATASYSESTTVLPNPQDLKLVLNFYKQTTDDYGEEFKGKFFIKIKRDGAINDFIYKTQDALNTFKSRDSAKLFYAQTWLLDQANGDAVIADTKTSFSSGYLKEILDIPTGIRYTQSNRNSFEQARKNFGYKDDYYSSSYNNRRITGAMNGNGLVLNPTTAEQDANIPSVGDQAPRVGWAATVEIGGTPTKINFGGTTKGIYNSNVYTGQDSINGYSMKEIDYNTPSNSGGLNNPMFVIDQSVGFIAVAERTDMVVDGVRTLGYRYLATPYVGDGFPVGRTNCTFKIVGVQGFEETAGNLGNAYNFFKYLKKKGQTFRFTNDPTNTVYTIQKSESLPAINTQCVDSNGNGCRTGRIIDETKLRYYEKAIVINIELNKGIVWSPIDEVDSQGLPTNAPLELTTTSNSLSWGATINAASEKLNKEKTASRNSSTFSACEIDFGEAKISSDSPAVFEVLPKEKVDLNLFYETPVTKMAVKNGMSVKTDYRTPNGDNPLHANAIISTLHAQQSNTGTKFQIKPEYVLHNVPAGETITVYKKDQNGNILYSQDIVLEIELKWPGAGNLATRSSGMNTVYGQIYNIIDVNQTDLKYYNCFAFGNGVESNRIFDDYNAVTIDKGPRVSTILDADYQEERKSNGIIYSGIYNSKSSFNSLNQFIQGEKITKDLNPDYGSIQKLFTRNTNVIVLCEDKTLKVLANKDALYNADGNVSLTSTNNVLGQVVPFVGEYGISNNPESFASYGYRCYYSDRKRGAVIRLSGDGITNIAEKGMSKFFRNDLDNSLVIKGSYDSLKDNYNITLNNQTVSFTEKVNGWTSFKSFLPENGISYSNSYYTFKEGEVYMHGENATRNTFYDSTYRYNSDSTSNFEASTLSLVFNGEPDAVKNFKTISYEGDSGWSADTITTDKETGGISSFVEKEGKYFNFIKGSKINNNVDLLKTEGLNVQGIGVPSAVDSNSNTSGSQHVITAVDIATNKEPKKWILNNSATNKTSTDLTLKFNGAQGGSFVPNFDFYVHPQTVKGVAWKVSETDFTFSYAESISNFSGTVSVALQNSGSLRVRVTIASNPWPTADTTSTITMTAGSAYQEQI